MSFSQSFQKFSYFNHQPQVVRCYINPMQMTEAGAKLLFKLISSVNPNENFLSGGQVQIENTIYQLDLSFPISIKRDMQKNLVELEVIERIDPRWYYQNDQYANQVLDFSFLEIRRRLGNLIINNDALRFIPYPTLKLDFISFKVISPESATLAERIFLDDFLTMLYQEDKRNSDNVKHIQEGFLLSGIHLFELHLNMGNVRVNLQLDKALALRESSHYEGEYRADVVNGFLDAGDFAKVMTLSGVLKNAVFIKKSDKLLKDYATSENPQKINKKNNLNQTYLDPKALSHFTEIGRSILHLKMNSPTIVGEDSDPHWQTREKKLPGILLLDFMNKTRIKTTSPTIPQQPDEITFDDFLDLQYELSVALLEQYFYSGIVHRDIKPENINIDLDDHMRCYIFDVNLAKYWHEDDKNLSVGALTYMSPEKFKRQISTHKSDVFSLMRMLPFLFGDLQPDRNQAQSPEIYQPKFPVLTKLEDTRLISKNHSYLIREMFNAAFEFDPAKRCHIDYIIRKTLQIAWERRREKAKLSLNKINFDNFSLAHDHGMSIWENFFGFKLLKDLYLGDHYQPEMVGEWSVTKLTNFRKEIMAKIDALKDDPMILGEFARSSGIRFIRNNNCNTKDLIKTEIKETIDNYQIYLSRLYQLHSTCQVKIQKQIGDLFELRNKYPFNLDNLRTLGEIYKKQLAKLHNLPVKRDNATLFKSWLFCQPAFQFSETTASSMEQNVNPVRAKNS